MTTTSPPPTDEPSDRVLTTERVDDEPSGGRAPLLPEAQRRVPALDGLRAVAVAVVVVYHVAPSWMPAGFLGVSLFFTLSGFLITRLLLAEHSETGGVALRRFWTRRFRRLTPAALVTLGLVTVAWIAFGWMTTIIAGDIVASLAQVANWRFIVTGTTYGVSTDASPVLHFWSLAIEEQFYLVFPVLVWAVVRRSSRPLRSLGLCLTCLLVASLAYTLTHSSAPLDVYFSTFSRAGELLIGALVAVITWRATRPRRVWLLGLVGTMALAVFLGLTILTRLTDPVWSRGGLTAVGVISALVVIGVTQPGPLQRVLASRPLVWVGILSYGIYLFHWPVLVALRTTDLPAPTVAAITIAASVTAAWVSSKLIENPIRFGRIRRPRPIVIGVPVMLTIAVLALWGGARSDIQPIEFVTERGIEDAAPSTSPTPSRPLPPAAPDPAPTTGTGPVPVAVFGDSTAAQLRLALVDSDPRIEVRTGWSDVGCALSRGGPVKGSYDTDDGWPYEMERCDWTGRWPETVAATGASTVIVYGGFWDTVPRENEALWDGWRTIEEPVVADHVRDEMVALTDAMHAAGAQKVVWLTLAPHNRIDSETNVRRTQIYNDLLASAARERPDVLEVVDLAGWFATQPTSLRPDGVHMTVETGQEVIRTYLADQLLAAASR
jgi:peptidoglycan/LPS O-acetylase OafA/YrhL